MVADHEMLRPKWWQIKKLVRPTYSLLLFDCTIKKGRTRLYHIKHWLLRKVLDVGLSLCIERSSTSRFLANVMRQFNERTIKVGSYFNISGGNNPAWYSPLLLELFSWQCLVWWKWYIAYFSRTGRVLQRTPTPITQKIHGSWVKSRSYL